MSNIEGESDATETGPKFGRIVKTDITHSWLHEARDFTPWLAEHIDILEERLSFKLELVGREERTSTRPNALKLDILAQDENEDYVIIENQFGQSNNDHLGKVLTYAIAFEAKVAIWIVEDPREEHRRVVTWLNESTPLTAYMFKIEVVKIGSSLPAPLLTLLVGPSESDREIQSSKLKETEDQQIRLKFSKLLLEHADKQPNKLHSGNSATTAHSIRAATGHGKTFFRYLFHKKSTDVDLSIDKEEEKWNDAVFKHLLSYKDKIKEDFGESIDFEETGRGRKLISRLEGGGLDDLEKWEEIIIATVDRMIKLESAIRPYLQAAVEAANAAVADAADAAVAAIDSDESEQQ